MWAWALIPYPILPPSLISHTVSVDVKHYERRCKTVGAQELRESRGGRPDDDEVMLNVLRCQLTY